MEKGAGIRQTDRERERKNSKTAIGREGLSKTGGRGIRVG